jgi:hypothetical protein
VGVISMPSELQGRCQRRVAYEPQWKGSAVLQSALFSSPTGRQRATGSASGQRVDGIWQLKAIPSCLKALERHGDLYSVNCAGQPVTWR